MNKIKDFIKKDTIIFLVLLFIFIIFSSIFFQNYTRLYFISIDGNQIGFINDEKLLNRAISEINSDLAKNDKDIFIEPKIDKNVLYSFQNSLEYNELKEELQKHSIKYKNAWALVKNGKIIAGLDSRDDALYSLNDVKNHFIHKDSIHLLNIEFIDNINVEFTKIPINLMFNKNDLVKKIIESTELSEIRFTSFTNILPLSKDSIFTEQLRPIKDNKNLLLLRKDDYSLDVVFEEERNDETILPRSTIFNFDETLLPSETITEREGQDGIVLKHRNVTFLNNKEISSTTLKEKITKDVIAKIIRVGEKSIFSNNGFIFPYKGYITSGFGPRFDGFHRGIDIAGKLGDKIVASKDGVVNFSGFKNSYGYVVFIDHDSNYSTRYAHLSQYIVDPGEIVKQGQVIGYMGSSGNSTGYHVHFEILKNGQIIDPMELLNE